MSHLPLEKGFRFTWRIKSPKVSSQELMESLKIGPILAQILASRGISKKSAEDFLNPSLSNLTPPDNLPDMEKATKRIAEALGKNETIMVHGDYDVDGLTSVALLVRNLNRLGAEKVVPYIPSRFIEGYGLSKKAIENAKRQGVSLFITVDCGVTALEEALVAREKGIDLIITDHHEPPKEIPQAVAVVNPKRLERPNELAGVGVTFKLLQGLYERLGLDPKPLLWDLDLVALGTIADQVPLLGENRILASFGLKALEKTLKVGLKALKRIAGVGEKITVYDILFVLGPRLNAAGRLSHAKKALRLLLTKEAKEAVNFAQDLDNENRERQKIEEEILEEAKEMAKRERDDYVFVLSKDGWHEGVIGIVASKIVEEFYRPTFLIALNGEYGKGSGRSIPNFDLFHALEATEDYLETYGGHKMAAGLKIKRDKLEAFREAMNIYGKKMLSQEDLKPLLNIDAKVLLGDLSDDILGELNKLVPFGVGNPTPLFLVEDVSIVGNTRTVGNGHLRFILKDETGHASAIFFGGGEYLSKFESGKTRIDAVFQLKEDTYAKRMAFDLNIIDFRIRSDNG